MRERGKEAEGVNEGNGMEGIGEGNNVRGPRSCGFRDGWWKQTPHDDNRLHATSHDVIVPSEPCQPNLARQHVLTMNILCLQLTLGPTDGDNDTCPHRGPKKPSLISWHSLVQPGAKQIMQIALRFCIFFSSFPLPFHWGRNDIWIDSVPIPKSGNPPALWATRGT